jgi:hypothetical protein
MLFPDQRIGCDGKKLVPIFEYKWAKLDKITF